MAKYEALAKHLNTYSTSSVRSGFDEISRDIVALPPSAHQYRAWWANDPSHVQARDGWLEAGCRTLVVDMDQGDVIFQREPLAREVSECLCGCGGIPERGAFMPGHDQNLRVRLESQVGGIENLWRFIDAMDEYMQGKIRSGDLAGIVRRHWPRS